MPTLLICLLEKRIAAAGVSSYVMGGPGACPAQTQVHVAAALFSFRVSALRRSCPSFSM